MVFEAAFCSTSSNAGNELKISHKLLFMFLLVAGFVVGLISVAIHFSIANGFSSYLAKSEIKTLDLIPSILAQSYESSNGWKSFADPKFMESVIRENENHNSPHPGPFPPDGGPQGSDLQLSAELPTSSGMLPEQKEEFPPAFEPPPFPPFRIELFKRIGIFDEKKQLLWGEAKAFDSRASLPIISKGQIVGYVNLAAPEKLSRDLENDFVAEQNKALMVVAVLSFGLATISAIVLSRDIVNAIQELVLATRRMSAGDLSHPLDIVRTDELGQLAKDLNFLAATLDQHDRAHKQWIADTSHELRTPVAVLRAQVEAIQDGIQEPNEKTVSILHDEVMTLGKLIDDLYDLARYDVKQLFFQFGPVEIGSLLAETIDSFSERFEKKRIQVQVSELSNTKLVVNADAARLKQLFANILENSLRYTNEGGRLKILCSMVADWVKVSFDDSEPGVSEDALLKIFERFYRVESSRSRVYGGSGLGLSISKTIAEGHGGVLKASPSELGGLRLEFSIPVAEVSKNG